MAVQKGAKPYRMAIYNVSCNKRKVIIVYLSLFPGLVLFMFINTYTNSIKRKQEFVILVSTIGSIISFTIFSIAKEPYMILHFPYIPVIAVLGGLIVICIVLPVIVSRRILDSK